MRHNQMATQGLDDVDRPNLLGDCRWCWGISLVSADVLGTELTTMVCLN